MWLEYLDAVMLCRISEIFGILWCGYNQATMLQFIALLIWMEIIVIILQTNDAVLKSSLSVFSREPVLRSREVNSHQSNSVQHQPSPTRTSSTWFRDSSLIASRSSDPLYLPPTCQQCLSCCHLAVESGGLPRMAAIGPRRAAEEKNSVQNLHWEQLLKSCVHISVKVWYMMSEWLSGTKTICGLWCINIWYCCPAAYLAPAMCSFFVHVVGANHVPHACDDSHLRCRDWHRLNPSTNEWGVYLFILCR